MTSRAPAKPGRYGPDSELVDFILGITFEIWEGRGVDLIHQYYAPDCVVYGLDGVQEGAEAMVGSTHRYLDAFPDRLLLADDVIWSNDHERGFYSSHRIESPMTNLGASAYGPATGKSVRVTAIADCVVQSGCITREWLVRDGVALIRQLDLDPLPAARRVAESRTAASADWLGGELARVPTSGNCDHELTPFAARVLRACWENDEQEALRSLYAPYAVLHVSPAERHSGALAIAGHFAALRGAFGDVRIAVDHVATQACPSHGEPSAGEREGLAPRMEEPSAGSARACPRMEEHGYANKQPGAIHMNHRTSKLWGLGLALALLALPLNLWAQEAAEEEGIDISCGFVRGNVICEEILVTATRRTANVQDVSVAVTAVTGEQLEALGINDLFRLDAITPGLQLGLSGADPRPAVVRFLGVRPVADDMHQAAEGVAPEERALRPAQPPPAARPTTAGRAASAPLQ